MSADRTRDPHRHQDRSRELSAQPGFLRAHSLPDLPIQSRLVRTGGLGRRTRCLGASPRGIAGLIIHTGIDDRDGGTPYAHATLHETICDSARRPPAPERSRSASILENAIISLWSRDRLTF